MTTIPPPLLHELESGIDVLAAYLSGENCTIVTPGTKVAGDGIAQRCRHDTIVTYQEASQTIDALEALFQAVPRTSHAERLASCYEDLRVACEHAYEHELRSKRL